MSYEPLYHAPPIFQFLLGVFIFIFVLFSIFLGPIFIKTIIPLALVGYEMIIANSALRASLAIYLNNRVFLSRNYRLIVAPRKFDVLKINICPRSEASRVNMLVLRTSNFQGTTIRPIVPRQKHSIVFIVHH